jgi:hypothetical protein
LQVLQQDYYTDLMKRFGPQDTTYASLFDAKDEPFIPYITKEPDFWESCEKYWNDHRFNKLKYGIEFLGVSKADDIITFPGLSWCMQLILGTQTTPRFTFMCAGSGLDLPSPFQQLLITEAASRINMTTTGTIARIAEAMQFLANFPASFQTITVRESGVNTLSVPNTGLLLNRNMFSSSPIVHVAAGTAFVLETRIGFTGL